MAPDYEDDQRKRWVTLRELSRMKNWSYAVSGTRTVWNLYREPEKTKELAEVE